MRRAPQLRRPIDPVDPLADYYNDLRVVARAHGSPAEATRALAELTADRVSANPVSVAQLGLGSLQLRSEDAAWQAVAESCARWLVAELDDDGVVEYRFAFTHTYPLAAPWVSAMAQGQSASLLLRVARTGGGAADVHGFAAAGARAARPLLGHQRGVAATTAEGVVLQEYPTTPPAHVLNGWIFALWGLHDVSVAPGLDTELAAGAGVAFRDGAATLAARLPLYAVAGDWSRYDLYPHPLVHVASPFYHRLHAEQLAVMSVLAPHDAFAEYSERWARSSTRPLSVAAAVGRKGLFRLIRPRRAA